MSLANFVFESDSDSDSDNKSRNQSFQQLDAAAWVDKEPLPGTSSQQAFSCWRITQEAPSNHITVKEKCARIKLAISLNIEIGKKMDHIQNILANRLKECRDRLKEVQQSSSLPKKERNSFQYSDCGMPYFRDKYNIPAPDNHDTILMSKTGMIDFYILSSVPGWTMKDKRQFSSLLLVMSRELKKNELMAKIAQLQIYLHKKYSKNTFKTIAGLQNEIDKLPKKSLNDLALPIDQEYDWDEISKKLHHKHKPHEYKSLWKLFLHPSINKSGWSTNERSMLHRIAYSNNLEDWDTIAQQLNTGRTGYQCFVYFRTNMSNTYTGQRWTKKEEEHLKKLIDYYKDEGYIPWDTVANSMPNRTKMQLYCKYYRLNEQRKGKFLPEEDTVILTCVEAFGKNFKRIAQHLQGRSAAQLRTRYNVIGKQKPSTSSTFWTVEEDKKLLQCIANKDTVVDYSELSKHFPGKNRMHLRTRYITLCRWVQKFPNRDLAFAPRRRSRRLMHGKASSDLNKALKALKKRMESNTENKSNMKKYISMDSPEKDIEDAIIALLVNERLKEDELKIQEESKFHEQTEEEAGPVMHSDLHDDTNLHRVLLFLKANLNKEKFIASSAGEKYPKLLKLEPAPSVVKVKSYSRKNPVNAINVGESADIWGTAVQSTSDYVFPPNLDTIMGCKRLLEYVSKTLESMEDVRDLNIGIMTRKNPMLKQEMNILMERIQKLFMWPMMLSNIYPELHTTWPINASNAGSEVGNPVDTTKFVPRKCKVLVDSELTD